MMRATGTGGYGSTMLPLKVIIVPVRHDFQQMYIYDLPG